MSEENSGNETFMPSSIPAISERARVNLRRNLPKPIRDFVGRIAKSVYNYVIPILLLDRTPIVIYYMGKAGSKSVAHSLSSYGLRPVFHMYKIDPDQGSYATPGKIQPGRRIYKDFFVEKGLLKNYVKGKKDAKYITPIREPIARNISGFFHNFYNITGEEYTPDKYTIEELIDMFTEKGKHDFPLNWFDDNVKKVLDIDVYDYDFNKEKGWVTIKEDNVELLIFKIETDDTQIEKALIDFLGLDSDFELSRRNVGEEKDYGEDYKKFKEEYKPSGSYMDKMYNSKYARHFYTENEIEDFKERWS